MQNKIQSAIHYSYYTLLFLVPLAMFTKTSELFEFNKMVVVYILTAIILFLWIANSLIAKKIIFKRTLLDIPIILFILSQFLSTITSINIRTSLLGYYSRYNGGLISMVCYAVLYWGFVSNFNKEKTLKAIYTTFVSAILVSIYAILQHFGIDAHIWVQDVQNRVFSTLGQPNWLAAFTIVLIPIAWAKALATKTNPQNYNQPKSLKFKFMNSFWVWILLSIIYYIVLVYTKSRSGFVGFAVLAVVFWGFTFIITALHKKTIKNTSYKFLTISLVIFILSLYNGTPWTSNIKQVVQKLKPQSQPTKTQEEKYQGPLLEVGGSSSTKIRKIVWTGAINIWKNYPILGTGIETFAYSYYNFRPVEHNLVSEWDFLYNKAHNEYLNYAATTGTLGLGTYLIMIMTMSFVTLKNSKVFKKFKGIDEETSLLHLSFFSGLVSIYVTNFFGFSVVPINLMMFILPAFSVGITENENSSYETKNKNLNSAQKSLIAILGVITALTVFSVIRYWYADCLYGQGKANNEVGNTVTALEYLNKAVSYSKKEPVIWQELSEANLNAGLGLAEKEDQRAFYFFDKAIQSMNTAIQLSENDVNIRRKRASMYIKLSAFEPNQLILAKDELLKTIELAPTDAKLWYNLGLVYARIGEMDTAEVTLEKTIVMKPDYEKARYAYALILVEDGKKEEALDQAEFIIKNINPNYQPALQFIEENK